MSDCSNAEIRDLLPDLLHDRVDAPTRARVVAHVDGCADCRSELELLRSLRSSLERGTPRVDVGRIVAALPAPARLSQRRAYHVWSDWRIAAAVTFIVAGGTSVVVIHNERDRGNDSATAITRQMTRVASETTAQVDSPAAAVRQTEARAATPVAPSPSRVSEPVASRAGTEALASTDEPNAGLGNSRIGDLNERQLKSLLNAIEHMDATPITDPEPVVLRVGSRTSSPNGL